ncbi:hypothetical protein MTR67_007040 [Solanum verrucosum]|uniref:Bulb-type lectin domain-containing protein n=1 Tax=Solanum verrucosum TaxID=315347 RepID=A0AAF0Q1B0_SOLVR|nr:hypothetical protein MTR67_007040 [Solanum verrucosum]
MGLLGVSKASSLSFNGVELPWMLSKLPTNEKLGTFGAEPVICFCCYQQGWDEVDYIFIQGHFAAYIWKYFSNILGFAVQQTFLSCYLLNWCGSQENPLNDTSSALNFTRQGILTLLNGSGRVIWSSDSTIATSIYWRM